MNLVNNAAEAMPVGGEIIISTQNQYILGYTLHQTTNDTATLPTHITSLQENLGVLPDVSMTKTSRSPVRSE